jgi:DNA-binding XRE family transcriptional regulator
MANDREPRSDLGVWLGEELRGARLAAGYTSQDQFARELGFDRTVIVKAETGARPPSDDLAGKIGEMFPGLCNGLYVQLATIARKSNGPIPGWFADWLDAERQAHTLRIWQPLIVPGLLQTAEYARALFVAAGEDADRVEELIAARLDRQVILDRPKPPQVVTVLDESVLHRLIGTPQIMTDQLIHLAAVSERPRVTIQMIPSDIGANAGLSGGFQLASTDGAEDVLNMNGVEDVTSETRSLVRTAANMFVRVQADALPRAASRKLIMEAAEQWKAR